MAKLGEVCTHQVHLPTVKFVRALGERHYFRVATVPRESEAAKVAKYGVDTFVIPELTDREHVAGEARHAAHVSHQATLESACRITMDNTAVVK